MQKPTQSSFNPNNEGTVILAQEKLESSRSAGIVIFALALLHSFILLALIFFNAVAGDSYIYSLLYLIPGLPAVTILLLASVAAGWETGPNTSGRVTVTNKAVKMALAFCVLAVAAVVLSFVLESRSDNSFQIYVWGIVWDLLMLAALGASIGLAVQVARYRLAYNRVARSECEKRGVLFAERVQQPLDSWSGARWMGSQSE